MAGIPSWDMKATSGHNVVLFHGFGWARLTWVKPQVHPREG